MTRTVRDIVEVVPAAVWVALAALACLSIVFGGAYLASAAHRRRLARQRSDLLSEVGLLQTALLPPVPETLGAVRTSVAYRPAEGLAAGGDFYDALTLPGGRAAFLLGDVSGHGREALARTAFVRYTLRAYLEAGLEPRMALQVAGRVMEDRLEGDFATVLVAIHDPASATLTYASAGHPPPIVVGGGPDEPILAGSSPPIGVGLGTGLRQTTVPLPAGALVCIFTDGLPEARVGEGMLGRGRLAELVAGLPPGASASDLIERVAGEASSAPDDMAACLISPTGEPVAAGRRSEQLEVPREDLDHPVVARFLSACGVADDHAVRVLAEARATAERHGGAVLQVELGPPPAVRVMPQNVVSIEAASLRTGGAVLA